MFAGLESPEAMKIRLGPREPHPEDMIQTIMDLTWVRNEETGEMEETGILTPAQALELLGRTIR